MSATSSAFWSATERIKDDLNEISALGIDMYAQLESNDDPGEVADNLTRIAGKLDEARKIVDLTIPKMQDVAASLDALASVKS